MKRFDVLINVFVDDDNNIVEYGVDSSNIDIIHSGSSYLRVVNEGRQIGTVGYRDYKISEKQKNYMLSDAEYYKDKKQYLIIDIHGNDPYE